MDMDRAISIARVFDAHPDLRPRKAGGDPPRIVIEPSLESVVAQHGLPIDWLTFREMKPEMEMGTISLFPGRGGAVAQVIAGEYEGDLWGNWIEQVWASKALNDPDFVHEVEQLFEELVIALDGTWAAVDLNVRRGPAVWKQLPGVFWRNYFGPAFITRYPALRTMPGTKLLPNGGIIVPNGTELGTDRTKSTASDSLRRIFEPAAFDFYRAEPNPALPTVEDHLAAAPEPDEMPWATWQLEREKLSSERKRANARKRLSAALAARPDPPPGAHDEEWSTSLDLANWPAFAKHLKRSLRGDLASPIGTALMAVIASASAGDENTIVLATDHGAVRFEWRIEDESTADVRFWGPAAIRPIYDSWFDS